MKNKDANIPLCNRRIKQLRLEKNWSQTHVAQQADISKNYLSMIESGARNPSEVLLCKLANILDVDYNWLISDCHTEKDTALEASAKTNLVNQFDGRQLSKFPWEYKQDLNDLDLSLVLWMLYRFTDLSLDKMSDLLLVDKGCLYDLMAGSSENEEYQRRKVEFREDTLMLLGDIDDFEVVCEKITETLDILKSEYYDQQLTNLRREMKTFLDKVSKKSLQEGVIDARNVPGIVGQFQLFDAGDNRVWHCFVCKESYKYKRKDSYKRIAEMVVNQTMTFSERDTVVLVTRDVAAFSNMLVAIDTLKNKMDDALPSYSLAMLRDNIDESVYLPCAKT